MSRIPRLFELMSEKNIKSKELSEKLGFSTGNISDWKSGRSMPGAFACASIANYFDVSVDYLLGITNVRKYEEKSQLLPVEGVRAVPLFETVSAGFGAYADSSRIGFMPVYIKSDYEAENTLAVKVKGDSMFPKIEDGDTVVVCRDMEWHNGDIVVALIDGDEGVVKRAFRSADHLTLESINPMYPPRRFDLEEMNRVQIVGKVRMIVKEV